MKVCGRCKSIKEKTFFSKNKSRSDGYNNICKSCDSNRKDKSTRVMLRPEERLDNTKGVFGLINQMYKNQKINSKKEIIYLQNIVCWN
ncbi:hypothetical protein Phi19:3_gp124 [Cellulophaga phage phi19:3]|uniref:Uncharacterized protein n=1 Tax=Cellulophaga phage phi19:3 TaxID=1327971 RepID=S0A002_9CAUD|nr:hypothetical protein Phi19:3_gp124 [Cellulophaga phage phi19:3]AGO47528.1 hypothetical protein Phi19:3_gp124 [Cellulophaga phage phi19:3]